MRLSIRLTIEHLKILIFFSGPSPLPHPRDTSGTPGPGAFAAPLWDWPGYVLLPSGLKREVMGTVLFTHSSSGSDNLNAWEYQGICHSLGYQTVILNLTRYV